VTLSTSTTTPRRPSPSPREPYASPITHTLNDAARITGLSRSTLYRHAAAGRLRMVRVGGRTLVDAVSLRVLVGVEA
jgi:excisionase family DNA binding protein